MTEFNNHLRQVAFLVMIIALAIVVGWQLFPFFPGFLGALTLYVLSRKWYGYLTTKKRWNQTGTALLFMALFLICIAWPIYFSIELAYSKIEGILKNPEKINQASEKVMQQVSQWTGRDFNINQLRSGIPKTAAGIFPKLLNGFSLMLGNLLMILFLFYFMLKNGRAMEQSVRGAIPLRAENIDKLANETVMMVRANAIGIPVISLIQGLFAMAGYWIFGIDDFVLLGLITGVFAFFPAIGTALVWAPLVIYLFSSGENGKAIGLAIYSLVATGNIDYVARITFLKKVGDLHPVVTILGLIVGLKLFGFWGFIFGPLLVSYVMLFIKVYKSEFTGRQELN